MSVAPRNPGEGLRLQQFGLKDSAYERPNQEWVCGHLCEGMPCAVGPDAKGRCLATTECRPIKKGERWVCTRRDTAGAPSPCGPGPLPDGACACPIATCSPVRSIRAKRARFALAAFALSVGVLSFFVLGPSRSDFVVPGELTDAHAQVLKAHRTEDCGTCHVAGHGDASQWLTLAVASPGGATQNDKCLICHLASLGRDAALPHGLPASTLARLTAAARAGESRTTQRVLASFAPAAPTTPQGELACATCHQEHGGRRRNLKTLSDSNCQACHKAQFESFSHGHPEFKAVPHDHTGIAFDHAKHEPRMPSAKLACAQCHRPDPVGRTMQFTTFEQACVGCHDQGKLDHHGDQIRGDARAVLQLPVMSLDKAGVWPGKSLAPGTAVTPMLQFLVSGDEDPAALQSLKSLAADVQAKGSPDEWEAEAEIKARLATAIKRVTGELTLDDEPPPRPSNRDLLRARIARAAGVPAGTGAVTDLLEHLISAADKTKAWQQHCLPQLADDLAGKLKPTTAPAANEQPAGDATWKPVKDASAWVVDADAVSVSYRSSHADSLDKSSIDLLAAGAGDANSKMDEKMTDDAFRSALRARLLIQLGGSCIKCHVVQPESGSLVVNWHAAGHTQSAGYVKFDHRPHLTLFPGAGKCYKCHKLEFLASVQDQPSPVALSVLSGNLNHSLAAHDKAGCAVCHTPTGAPDTCLTCHVYHVTR